MAPKPMAKTSFATNKVAEFTVKRDCMMTSIAKYRTFCFKMYEISLRNITPPNAWGALLTAPHADSRVTVAPVAVFGTLMGSYPGYTDGILGLTPLARQKLPRKAAAARWTSPLNAIRQRTACDAVALLFAVLLSTDVVDTLLVAVRIEPTVEGTITLKLRDTLAPGARLPKL
jgi:hypothetical protein